MAGVNVTLRASRAGQRNALRTARRVVGDRNRPRSRANLRRRKRDFELAAAAHSSVLPQVLVLMAKSPLAAMLLIFNVALPVFDIFTDLPAEVFQFSSPQTSATLARDSRLGRFRPQP